MTVPEKARGAKGPVEAMRMAEAWMNELSAEDDLTDARAQELDKGLAILEQRFPEVTAYPGGAEEFAQSRGHGTGSRGGKGKKRKKAEPKPAQRDRTSGRAVTAIKSRIRSHGRRPARGRTGRRRGGPRVGVVVGLPTPGRAWQQTGVPGAVTSGTSLFLTGLGALIGLSLLYLVLTSAERGGAAGKALPHLLGSVTSFLQRFIAPVDIFSGTPTATAAGARGAGAQSYNDLVLSGQVAGPPNLVGMLPELQALPGNRSRARRNPRLGAQTRRIAPLLPQPRR